MWAMKKPENSYAWNQNKTSFPHAISSVWGLQVEISKIKTANVN